MLDDINFIVSIEDVGIESNVMSFVVRNSYGQDISSHYLIFIQYGRLQVTPREIVITLGSAEKEFDGEPLTCETITYTGSLVDGHEIYIEFGDSITNVGICDNTPSVIDIIDEYNNSYLRNYKVTIIDGLLKVTPKSK